MRFLLVALAIMAVVSGCGRGSAREASIAALGDSITAGYRIPGAYPERLAHWRGVPVHNFGFTDVRLELHADGTFLAEIVCDVDALALGVDASATDSAALASRIETRVRDGMTVIEASEKCLREAKQRKRAYGWLCLSPQHWCVTHTTLSMPYVVVGQGPRGGTILSASSRSR